MFQLTDKQLQRRQRDEKVRLHVSTQPIWLLELVKADYENMGAMAGKHRFPVPLDDRRRLGTNRQH